MILSQIRRLSYEGDLYKFRKVAVQACLGVTCIKRPYRCPGAENPIIFGIEIKLRYQPEPVSLDRISI